MTQARTLLLGPPGCGKTERLLTEFERCLEAGIAPEEIAFVSFTRAAITEARGRIEERFGFDRERLPWVRTLHSLAFRQLGLRRADVFDRRSLIELADLTGEELTGHTDLSTATIGERGDALLFLDQTARARCVTLEEEWNRHGAAIDWFRLLRFVTAYDAFRKNLGQLDFTDILEAYVGRGDHDVDPLRVRSTVPVRVAFIDEAQDLTKLQWEVAATATAGAQRVIVAGDDDQAIYAWAGAEVDALLTFDGEREVLSQSYRLPQLVHSFATDISAQIERRHDKRFYPRDTRGQLEWITRIEEIDLSRFTSDGGTDGTWLLLARTRFHLSALVELAREQGVSYSLMGTPAVDPDFIRLILTWEAVRRGEVISAAAADRLREAGMTLVTIDPNASYSASDLGLARELPVWHEAFHKVSPEDREYLVSCLRNGEKMLRPPRVRISTVHGAKGAQADRVLLLTDLTDQVWRGAQLDPDAELRVAYVAVTRAREALFIATPRGRYGWQI